MVLIGALLSLPVLALTSVLTAESAHARGAIAHGCADALTTRPHMLPDDVAVIQRVAQKHNLEIVVMAPNPASLRFRSRAGYAAKPAELKACKTAVSGPAEGLVQCPEIAFKSHAEWLRNKADLLARGYEVLGPEQSYLVRRIEDGKFFFSDYDLFSVRELGTRRPAYSEALRAELNAALGRNLVRHGPLEDYALRADVAIKLPLLVIPGGSALKTIESRAELESDFGARGLPIW